MLKITTIHCFVLFPGGPPWGSPGPHGVSSQKVQRVSEVEDVSALLDDDLKNVLNMFKNSIMCSPMVRNS